MLSRVVAAFAAAVFVYGLTFGVLSRAAGLSMLQATSMSLLVFAGAAQFSSIAVLRAGADPWLAVTTALTVNLRLFPLGLAASTALSRRPAVRALQCLAITDESIAIATDSDGRIDAHLLVRSGMILAAAWVSGTAIGTVGANVIEDPARFGLDAAFPAGFIALLVPRLRQDAQALAVALLGAAIALVAAPLVPVGLPTMLAAAAAAWAARP